MGGEILESKKYWEALFSFLIIIVLLHCQVRDLSSLHCYMSLFVVLHGRLSLLQAGLVLSSGYYGGEGFLFSNYCLVCVGRSTKTNGASKPRSDHGWNFSLLGCFKWAGITKQARALGVERKTEKRRSSAL